MTQETKHQIIKAAIALLIQEGSEGLTLRKTAIEAGISLGNLQYHYKNKQALLLGVSEHYVGMCIGLLDDYDGRQIGTDTSVNLTHFFDWMMSHFEHLSDMCRMFREIWALSSRALEIEKALKSYYHVYANKMTDTLVRLGLNHPHATRTTALVIPYFEGFSITGPLFDQTQDDIVTHLVDLTLNIRED